ncbi:MBL fold metallo-hydrolase [Alphaproteobacteria bacterium]|nr:MBL fold metallo-hydrolase [Alphaproteobacteria bacterium]
MLVRFWGTRGSIPSPITSRDIKAKIVEALLSADGRRFADEAEANAFVDGELEFPVGNTYGGNTPCVELDLGEGEFMVFDMGSGLRPFGIDAIERFGDGRPKTFNIFMSHLHWDHILGFPFFNPAFMPGCKLNFFGGHSQIEYALRRQQEKISFPVPFDFMKAEMKFTTLTPGETYEIGGCEVGLIKQCHDNDSFGYRVERGGKSMVYSTDAEHKSDDLALESAFVDFLRDADLVISDTMYSLGDAIAMKEGWGHSSGVIAVGLCHRAHAKRLAMFHHDPLYADKTLHEIYGETARYEALTRMESTLEVICASDGFEIRL